MNALFISNDPLVRMSHSPVRERMRRYASAIGTLHILQRGQAVSKIQDGALTIHEIKISKLFAPFALSHAAHALIRREHIEIVSAQDPFEHGLAALLATKGTDAKLHLQVHTDFLSPWFTRSGNLRAPKVTVPWNRFRRILADYVLPHADGIRVVSKRIRDSVVARYGSRVPEPEVIPIVVPLTDVPPVPLPQHPWTFSLITVSRLAPEKRIEDILMALARVRQRSPAAGLFIIGEGVERTRLTTQVKKLNLEDAVMFLGWREDARGLLKSAQAYIQASAYEGYGMSLIEAALARLPIITTDVGIVGEVFTGYKDVFAVPPADPTALAACVQNLIENHQSREVLARGAEAAAHAHLMTTEDQVARIVENLSATVTAKP